MKLIAGAWVGEFGWQLMAWQGVIRAMSKNFDETIIYGLPGHEYLYQDFASEYHDFDPQGTEPNMWMNNGVPFELPMEHWGQRWVKPQQLVGLPDSPQQEFIRYGKLGDRTLIAYHARNLTKYGSGYMNWNLRNWGQLLSQYDRDLLVCIGTKSGSDYIIGDDLRGAPLEHTCDILAQSSVLIGPSSGAIHLGSLCGTPHVTWSGHIRNKDRYEELWNPLKTPVRIICPEDDPWETKKEWQPTPREVMNEINILTEKHEKVCA